jgi:hypothetical protein
VKAARLLRRRATRTTHPRSQGPVRVVCQRGHSCLSEWKARDECVSKTMTNPKDLAEIRNLTNRLWSGADLYWHDLRDLLTASGYVPSDLVVAYRLVDEDTDFLVLVLPDDRRIDSRASRCGRRCSLVRPTGWCTASTSCSRDHTAARSSSGLPRTGSGLPCSACRWTSCEPRRDRGRAGRRPGSRALPMARSTELAARH